MPRLEENPTKARELAHWLAFVAELPADSYLASYLAGSGAHLESAMANDLHCELLTEIRAERDRAHADAAAAKLAITGLNGILETKRNELRNIEAATVRGLSALEDLTRAAGTLASQAYNALRLAKGK